MDQAAKIQAPKDEIGALIQTLDRKDWQTTVQREVEPSAGTFILPQSLPKEVANPNLPSVVVVDKGEHKTHVLQMVDGNLADVLTVPNAVGKVSTPTPSKRWTVSDKRLDPIWTPPKDIGGDPVAPYKVTHRNPIGLAFIRLDGSNYGLHGTNNPGQIGKSVSHGCMRHNNDDILKIYPLVDKGTAVYTVNHFSGSSIRLDDFRKK